jgi:hypothetical protein
VELLPMNKSILLTGGMSQHQSLAKNQRPLKANISYLFLRGTNMHIDQPAERKLGSLRIWNIVVGLILAVQAVIMALLTNDFSLPVTATFMTGRPGTPAALHHWFNISTGWGVCTFMAICLITGFIYTGSPCSYRLMVFIRLKIGFLRSL